MKNLEDIIKVKQIDGVDHLIVNGVDLGEVDTSIPQDVIDAGAEEIRKEIDSLILEEIKPYYKQKND